MGWWGADNVINLEITWIQIAKVVGKLLIYISYQLYFLNLAFPFFIPIIYLQCNQYPDDHQYNLANSIAGIFQWFVILCEFSAYSPEKIQHSFSFNARAPSYFENERL